MELILNRNNSNYQELENQHNEIISKIENLQEIFSNNKERYILHNSQTTRNKKMIENFQNGLKELKTQTKNKSINNKKDIKDLMQRNRKLLNSFEELESFLGDFNLYLDEWTKIKSKHKNNPNQNLSSQNPNQKKHEL